MAVKMFSDKESNFQANSLSFKFPAHFCHECSFFFFFFSPTFVSVSWRRTKSATKGYLVEECPNEIMQTTWCCSHGDFILAQSFLGINETTVLDSPAL